MSGCSARDLKHLVLERPEWCPTHPAIRGTLVRCATRDSARSFLQAKRLPLAAGRLRDLLLCAPPGPRSYFACMQLKRVLQQEIAVFGGSRSGKTVLVSSFYGSTQEPEFMKESLFDLTADDTGLGDRLFQNYLGMKDYARAPDPTPRDFSTSYAFSLTIKANDPKPSKSLDAVRLIWHDYPGEWWEKEEDEPAIAQLRVATFRSLLGSDVAILLVDGQKFSIFHDHAAAD